MKPSLARRISEWIYLGVLDTEGLYRYPGLTVPVIHRALARFLNDMQDLRTDADLRNRFIVAFILAYDHAYGEAHSELPSRLRFCLRIASQVVFPDPLVLP